jgi:hypothetical protein
MRFAKLGALAPDTDRPAGWAADKPAILSYLNNGLMVLAARTLLPDEMDPARPAKVEVVTYTDGEWIRDAQTIYFAEHHYIPIDPDLIEHARRRGFQVGPVPPEAAADVMDALQQASAHAEPEPDPGRRVIVNVVFAPRSTS